VSALAEAEPVGQQLPLRPYQREAIDAVRVAWEGEHNRVAIILPTGSGKTVVLSHMAAEEPGRTLILAHRQELVDQAAAKLAAIAPDLNVGVEMANRRAGEESRAVVASVQTLASPKRIGKWARNAFSQVIVDECHHSITDTYTDILQYFGCYSDTRTLGVTATLARGDKAGLGSVWQSVAYTRSILEMIADGYLVNPRGISVPIDIDLAGVNISDGDYAAGALGDALTGAHFELAVAQAYVEHAGGRPGIVFTPTVATAQAAAKALRERGVKAEAVWGDMDPGARRAAINGLRDGTVDVLANCQILTEGTDIPRAEVAIMARPTRSAPLFTQMCGRVLRPYPGKTEALVIDIVGITADHKLCTLMDLAEGVVKKKGKKEPLEEGETLVDAVERITKIKLGTARNVNLFTESHTVWLQTRKGYWFIPAGDGFVALYPGDDCYAVALFPPGREPPLFSPKIPDLALAMTRGEQQAVRVDGASGRGFSVARRTAGWRANSEPSEVQIETCARMRIDVPPGATRGDVSDLITAKRASSRIDRLFVHHGRTR
jgi:superfamily II DNA or RNA helicase